MAGDKTYITDGQGKLHRATRVHAVTPTDIVWSSNPNDYTVQVKIDGKWHRAVLTMDAGAATYFDNINIDKALVTGADGKQHTALIVKPESTVTLSDIKTDTHGTIAGTTTGETAVSTYSENWSDVKWQDNVNVYKVLVTGSDGKVHTALLTTSAGGGVQVIVLGPSPLLLPDAIANSLSYVKAFGGTEQRNLPDGYIERQFIYMMDGSYLLTDIVPTYDCKVEMDFATTSLLAGGAYFLGGRTETYGGILLAKGSNRWFLVDAFGSASGDRYTSSVTPTVNTRYKFTFNNKVSTLESGGSVLFTNTSTGENANGAALCINGLNANGTLSGGQVGIYLYSFKVWNAQGELVADYVPAVQKGTVPVVGFYDTVSGTFKTATAGTFAAGGEAVPTPDAPMDIVSNNGVLKARHQSGLPLGYTLLDYIDTDGDSWIDTGVTPTATTLQFDYKMQILQQDYVSLFGAVAATSPRYGFRVYYQPADATNIFYWQSGNFVGRQVITWDDVLQGTVIATQGISVVSTINGTTQTYNDSSIDLTQSDTMFLGTTHLGTTSGRAPTRIWSFKITKDGTVVRDFVPAKNASNVIGMYDLVSGQFFTNAGTGTFTAGDPVSDPVEIYTDGTVETIEDTIGNTAVAEMLLKVGNYQDVQSIIDGVVTRNVGVKVLDGTENWNAMSYSNTYVANILSNKPSGNVRGVCSHYPWVNRYIDLETLNYGYLTPGTITLAIKNKDCANVTAFKTWLADQYAAGTPVTVIYPLAQAVTEQVAPQVLNVQTGDNILEITQASLSGLELEAEYTKVG